jgi:hypothetical protein
MALGLAFYIIMLVWLILALVHGVSVGISGPIYWYMGMNIIVWVLFLLVGWRVFGPPLHG